MAVKQFNPKKIHNFVLVDRNVSGSKEYAFNSYTDTAGTYTSQPGSVAMYVQSKDDRGRDKGKYFNLNQSHSNFMVREGEKDIYGRSQFDFLANSPDCKDSPNGFYQGEGEDRVQVGVIFKLMDTAGDADVAIEASKRRAKAEMSALEVDDETLQDLAAHIGIFGEANNLMRHQVHQWASKRPLDYFEVLNSGDRAIRAIVRKAVSEGIFTKKGEIIMWGATVVGPTEDGAVSNLMRDGKDILEALEKKMDLSNKIELKGKPGPKPKLEKTK